MERTITDQTENIERVLEDAKAFGINEVLFSKIEGFLDDYWGSMKVHPFTFQQVNGWPGIRWDIPTGYCSTLFDPESDIWTFDAKFTVPADAKYNSGMVTTFTYTGGPSFHIEQVDGTQKPYYVLPEEVDAKIKLPDTFFKQYEPLLCKHKARVIWETNRYDGMIEGYVEYNNNLYYAEMVEETDFERNRMFALYELSFLEKLAVAAAKMKWHLVINYKFLWNLHVRADKRRWQKRSVDGVKRSLEKKQQFRNEHKIVGYISNL